jgi:hypothetical protein
LLAAEHEVSVITGWPVVFENSPDVKRVDHPGHPMLWQDVIQHGEYIDPEPYHDVKFYRQGIHLIESFCGLLGVTGESDARPIIYLSAEEQAWAVHFRDSVLKQAGRKRLVMFHPFGASYQQQPWGGIDPSHRSMSLDAAVALVDKISQQYPEVLLFNATALGQFHPNVWQQTLPFRQLFAACSVADFYLGADSSTSHVMAAFRKPGVTMFGATDIRRFGYNVINFQKPGYPKSYNPFRFQGFVDLNGRAMLYGDQEIGQIVDALGMQLT